MTPEGHNHLFFFISVCFKHLIRVHENYIILYLIAVPFTMVFNFWIWYAEEFRFTFLQSKLLYTEIHFSNFLMGKVAEEQPKQVSVENITNTLDQSYSKKGWNFPVGPRAINIDVKTISKYSSCRDLLVQYQFWIHIVQKAKYA